MIAAILIPVAVTLPLFVLVGLAYKRQRARDEAIIARLKGDETNL